MDVWQVRFVAAALPLSDKTMTQYDEKQRRLSVNARIRKKKNDDTLVNSRALSACACVRVQESACKGV